MSIKVWIGREFETQHEREQVAEVVRCLRNAFEKTADQINLLCNFEFGDAPVDLAVLKADALIVVDLKTANGAVKGGANGPWKFSDASGFDVEMNKGRGRNKNPFIQMRNYRHSAISFLQKHASTFMSNQQLGCLKCIDRFVKANVLLFPSLEGRKDHVVVEGTYKLWFAACRLKDFCQLIQSQTSSFDFDERQERKLIRQVLGLQEAVLVGDAPAMPRADAESWITDHIEEHPEQDLSVSHIQHEESLVAGTEQNEQSENPSLVISVDDTRPVIDPNDVKYISIGVKGAVEAKKLPGEVIEVFYQQEPTYDMPGAWGALCVFRYDGTDKDILAVKRELDYYLEDEHASSVVGNRIVWAFPEHSIDANDETMSRGNEEQKELGPRPLSLTLPTLDQPVKTLDTHAFLPRALGDFIYSIRRCPYSRDIRDGDDIQNSLTEESADVLTGRYMPISFGEAYGVFDMFFDRVCGKTRAPRREVSVGVQNGFVGGSLLGFLYALRRNASATIEKVVVHLIGDGEDDFSIPIVETLSNSGEFGFAVECTQQASSTLDFLLVCGRRDGSSCPVTSNTRLAKLAEMMSDDGVIWLSDIAGASYALTFERMFNGFFGELLAKGWKDLTQDINGEGAVPVGSLFPQQYSCKVLGQDIPTSRTIVYRLMARGDSLIAFTK